MPGLRDAIRGTWLWRNVGDPIRANWQVNEWLAAGRPVPVPHSVKARNLLSLADLYGLDTLVETGTYKGHMIDATVSRFKKVYSIEVFPPLASAAREKYRNNPKVTIIEGDSGAVFAELLPKIAEPVLFWLDGHYSGEGTGIANVESPVIAEIDNILKLRAGFRDVIMIDDARCFTGEGGYPRLDQFLTQMKERFQVTPRLSDDAVVIATPT